VRRTTLGLFVIPLLGCGGSTAVSHATDAGADAREGADASTEAGSDAACPQPPSAPTYDCTGATLDAGTCGPWGSSATSPSYPVGCVVTTTMEGSYCGPVTCNCGPSFGLVDGGLTWTCAL
jgi:hypothetical protein